MTMQETIAATRLCRAIVTALLGEWTTETNTETALVFAGRYVADDLDPAYWRHTDAAETLIKTLWMGVGDPIRPEHAAARDGLVAFMRGDLAGAATRLARSYELHTGTENAPWYASR